MAVIFTNIYGLVDPRRPDWVMYVGKGLEKRARSHWQEFTGRCRGVNALLRRWFEQLKADGVEPSFIFLEENVANWQEAERDWITAWRRVNSQLCNIADGGNAVPLESVYLGCKHPNSRAALLQSAKNRTPEQISESGRRGGFKLKKLYPNLARECGFNSNSQAALIKHRTSQHQRKAALSARHNQHHFRRSLLNLKACRLCQQEYAFRSDFGC